MQLQTATIQITAGMRPYINTQKAEMDFKQRALLLYPFIKDGTISHGRAAEALGISKWSLIELYGSLGIPYISMEQTELEHDIAVAVAAAETE